MESIKVIRENLKIACDIEKSYADHRLKAFEFEVGDRTFLKLCYLGKVQPNFEEKEN